MINVEEKSNGKIIKRLCSVFAVTESKMDRDHIEAYQPIKQRM